MLSFVDTHKSANRIASIYVSNIFIFLSKTRRRWWKFTFTHINILQVNEEDKT